MNNSQPKSKDYQKDIQIIGMTCINCARRVEKSLQKINGVKFASVNLATESAYLISERDISFPEIKEAVESAGYGVSEKREELGQKRYKKAKERLILAWIVTIPLSLLMIFHMFGHHIPGFVWIEIISVAFVLFYCGKETMKSAWIALLHHHSNMDTLITIGSVTSWITAILNYIGLPIISFGTLGAMIITIHLTGRFIESHLRDKAAKEIKALISLQAKEATVVFGKEEIKLPIMMIKKDQLIKVKPGERIPVDGIIIEGLSVVDESFISGEAIPKKKEKDDLVIGGSINLSGPLTIQVTKVGEESFLSQMIQLIKEAQGTKVPIQALADKITNWFVPIIILLAIISALFWYFNLTDYQSFLLKAKEVFPWVLVTENKYSFAIFVFISTVVIACPCALGLATPMALVVGSGLAAKKGLIIRNAEAIQTSKDVAYVLMDKTGTITDGKPAIIHHNLSPEEMNIVASIESNSHHPLAQAIAGNIKDKKKIDNIKEIPGKGVTASYNGTNYFIGKPEEKDEYIPYLKKGQTVVEVLKDNQKIGFIVLADRVRKDSKEAIAHLKELNIVPVMVTGDHEVTARVVAEEIGIEKIYAGVKPEEKLKIVRKYQSSGKKVLMIGDGINDAASLKGADIGVAMGKGADLALDSADIVIIRGGITGLIHSIKISTNIFKIIRQNLFWAFLYNTLAIPMAMLGLLHPIIAEGAMIFSSITVILNSLRIREVN
ncbi:MAG: copper-translocating P-type ATPase [Candidatus Atribacteria bacterium]|nr:copper-translocating P-type ATPase [Candidatus Atribacteria bacterium]